MVVVLEESSGHYFLRKSNHPCLRVMATGVS